MNERELARIVCGTLDEFADHLPDHTARQLSAARAAALAQARPRASAETRRRSAAPTAHPAPAAHVAQAARLAPAADPWRRFMGFAYEAVLLFGVVWFADYAFSALTQFRGDPGALRSAFQWFTLGVLAVYFTGFWSAGRRSLPMKTMALQLQTHDGKAVPVARALARFALASALAIGALAAGFRVHPALYALLAVPYLWSFFDRDRRALYDVLVGTRLAHVDPAPALRSVDV